MAATGRLATATVSADEGSFDVTMKRDLLDIVFCAFTLPDLPFFDPAIMSMTRSQAQNAYGGTAAAAAHAHAINNFGARGSYGYGGGAGAFAPFDSAAGLHAGFGNQGEQQQRGGAPGLSPAYGYSTVS